MSSDPQRNGLMERIKKLLDHLEDTKRDPDPWESAYVTVALECLRTGDILGGNEAMDSAESVDRVTQKGAEKAGRKTMTTLQLSMELEQIHLGISPANEQ